MCACLLMGRFCREMNNVNVGIKGVLAGKKSCTYTPKWMKRKQKEAKAWGKAYGADCMANRLPDNDPYFGTAKQVATASRQTECVNCVMHND